MRPQLPRRSLIDQAWSAVGSLVVLAIAVRLAAAWLSQAMPLLFILSAIASVFWLTLRRRSTGRPWDGMP